MKKAQILIALITISSLTVFNSCSSDADTAPKETVSEEAPTEAAKENPLVEDVVKAPVQTKVNPKFVNNWEKIRTDSKSLSKVFAKGNMFSFKLEGSSSDSILVRPFLTDNDQFGFYILKAEDNSFIQCSYVSNKTKTLPDSLREHPNNIDTISYTTAKRRVNRWQPNSKGQANWITFNVDNNTVYKYFIINSMDIEIGQNHDCFLSLRKNSTKSIISNEFVADLVIVNTKTGTVVVADRESLEDVVLPVPPYKSYKH
tara:strand:+ start:28 stop:801 length:774 start_codon:yes stop_codon:yes gene_type:complete